MMLFCHLRKIVRPAESGDLEKVEENGQEAEKAFNAGVGKIART